MRKPDWPRVLVAVSLAAGMALVAQSEIQLALAVGWPVWLAWCAAVSLDGYVLAAVLARKDILPPVLVSAASVLASHGVYAAPTAWASGTVGQGHLVWPLAAGCSVVPLLVTWRVHGLLERKRPPRSAERVKPQVSAPVTRPVDLPREPVALHSVSRSTAGQGAGHDDRAERVRALRAQGLTWTATAGQVGVSVSTAKRLAS